MLGPLRYDVRPESRQDFRRLCTQAKNGFTGDHKALQKSENYVASLGLTFTNAYVDATKQGTRLVAFE